MRRWRAVVLALLLVVGGAGAVAARAGQGERRRPASMPQVSGFMEVLAEPVAAARGAVFSVRCGDAVVATATMIGADGLAVTKASELMVGRSVQLLTRRGRVVPASLVAVDRQTDLALLKAQLGEVPFVSLQAPAEAPPIGRMVVAAGVGAVPVAAGIVSVAPRSIARRPVLLGVEVAESKAGPRVRSLLPEMGAARAGLKKGDVLTAVDGHATATRGEVLRRLKGMAAGDQVTVTVLRGGRTMQFEIDLSPMTPQRGGREARMNRMGGPLSERADGFAQVVQHDAVLRPEHAGGPLFDLDGRLVGINIARAGRIASYALPVPLVAEAVGRMLAAERGPAEGGAGGA